MKVHDARSTMRAPFTDDLCDAFTKNLHLTIPADGQLHYGSEPTSSRRMFLAEIERLNREIRETSLKLHQLRKSAVSFAVYEALGDDAAKDPHHGKRPIEWDVVERTCTYYEKYSNDKNTTDTETRRRRIALEFALDDMQRARDELLSACMER